CGTTGEAATLTPAEQERVIALTVETARGRAKVVAGVGSNATAATIERARAARAAGADAVLVVAPYYNKPTQAGLLAHFRAVAEVPRALGRRCRDAPADRAGRRRHHLRGIERSARSDGQAHGQRALRRVGRGPRRALPAAPPDGSELHRVEPRAGQGRACAHGTAGR